MNCSASTRRQSASRSRRSAPSSWHGTTSKRPRFRHSQRKPRPTDTCTPRSSTAVPSTRSSRNLGTGATAGMIVPDEHIIDPWSTPLAFAYEAMANGADRPREPRRCHVRSRRRRHHHHHRSRATHSNPIPRQRGWAARRRTSPRSRSRRIHDPTAPRRVDRVRQVVQVPPQRNSAARADLAHQGCARRPNRVRQRDARTDRRGCRRQDCDRLDPGRHRRRYWRRAGEFCPS